MLEMVHCQKSCSPARIICLGLFGSLVVATATQHLLGQAPAAYDEFPYPPSLMVRDLETDELKLDEKKLKTLIGVKSSVLLGNSSLQENSAAFKSYYTEYLFRAFSQ